MKNCLMMLFFAMLMGGLQANAASIINHDDFSDGGVSGVDLDAVNDWWIHGADAATETFSKKINSGITLVAQGGGVVLAQNRTAHTYVWANGTATLDNPSAPAAHDPNSYRRREYDVGLLNGAPSLDLTKGAYYTVDVTAGNTGTNIVTVYGLARRNNEIYVEAMLRDSTKTVTHAVLLPTLLASQTDDDAVGDISCRFSFAYQANNASDILSFTVIGYNDSEAVDRSLTIDAVTVAAFGPPPPSTLLVSNGDFSSAAQTDIRLDEVDDWWIHGSNETVDVFSQKTGSGIVLTAQGGGEIEYGDRTAHTYVWSNSTATVDNPSAPAAHDTDDYRRRQYAIGLLGGASTLDLTKGAYYSVDVTAGNTQTNRLTVYSMGRRNDEIYVEAFLQDSAKTVTNAVLVPTLLTTQPDNQTVADVSFSFSLDFQAAASNDVLSFTIAGYNDDTNTTDRSLAIDAVTLQDIASLPAPVPNTNIPNVIIIFTDDHGYTDLGIHGIDSNVHTPMLDSLAAGGALITHGYATAPQCVPSRAGIMSGRIQNTFGTRQNGNIWGPNPLPLDVPSVAERIAALGTYTTGMVGKWHLNPPADAVAGVDYPGVSGDYDPEDRGFQEYWRNSTSPYVANFDLAGNSIAHQSIGDSRNRVIVQGEAAEAFIERNVDKPFFLYLSLYGPHVPVIATNDPYYQSFPVLDYPNYPADMDDVRRKGLALIHAMDDAVAGVMQKLRDLGIEENTLILFSGDNGAQPKFWNSLPGAGTVDKWDGSENLPLRGEKGSLWEGGIKVPMFAYWKGTIASNQVIDEAVWTLDFTATALKLAGGTLPAEFDGVDILPYLSGETNVLARSQPMFWDWGEEIAIRKGDWKMLRDGSRKNLFNLARDPMELYDVKADYPEKFQQLETELMAWYNVLPAEGQSPLGGDGINFYVTGATSHPADSRYVLPFSDGSPIAYPAPLQYGIPAYNSDGDALSDWDELMAGNDPVLGSDLFRIEQGHAGTNGSFVVEIDGLRDRLYTLWHTDNLSSNLWKPVVTNGPLPADALISLGDTQTITQGFYKVEVSE